MKQGTITVLVLLAFYSTVTVGRKIKFKKCEGEAGYVTISSVDVTPCDADPCVFIKGTTVNTTVTFTPTKPVEGGKLEILGILGRFKIKLPLDEPDICKGHNVECPLKEGEQYKFFVSLVVKNYFPPVPLTLQAEVMYEKKRVLCIQFKGKIQQKGLAERSLKITD